jgi:3-oxoacyl-ACP reductase-like protein
MAPFGNNFNTLEPVGGAFGAPPVRGEMAHSGTQIKSENHNAQLLWNVHDKTTAAAAGLP